MNDWTAADLYDRIDELRDENAKLAGALEIAKTTLAALRHLRRVETADELEALPIGTIIRDGDGDSMHKLYRPGGEARWYCSKYDHRESDPVSLPATVLWTPEGEQ